MKKIAKAIEHDNIVDVLDEKDNRLFYYSHGSLVEFNSDLVVIKNNQNGNILKFNAEGVDTENQISSIHVGSTDKPKANSVTDEKYNNLNNQKFSFKHIIIIFLTIFFVIFLANIFTLWVLSFKVPVLKSIFRIDFSNEEKTPLQPYKFYR